MAKGAGGGRGGGRSIGPGTDRHTVRELARPGRVVTLDSGETARIVRQNGYLLEVDVVRPGGGGVSARSIDLRTTRIRLTRTTMTSGQFFQMARGAQGTIG